MPTSTGQFAFLFLVALLLACGAAWVLVARFRRAMRRLMSAPLDTAAPAPHAQETPEPRAPLAPPAPVTPASHRHAAARLTLLLVTLSVLIAASGASIWLVLAFPGEPFAWKRAALLALLHVWPLFPVLALAAHWSRARLAAALALWALGCFGVMSWRQIELRPFEALLALAVEAGPGLAMVGVIFIGRATRAVAPWLLPLFIALTWASMLGIDALGALVERRSPLLAALPAWLGAGPVMTAFALLPWLVAWWPARRLGRALARAYAHKRLSELMVMFTAVWAAALLIQALSVASSAGLAGVAMFAPLLWVPLVLGLNARWFVAGRPRPPTLLVLRVFQHDAQVQALFDHVVGRWRLAGNTVLIAGTDLIDRTLDADDIFTFIDGRLAERFIRTPADVAPRIAAFDLAPDADGRYRVNECYCHDAAWQPALAALVAGSDLVLMDLRGFQARNAGCRHELAVLAQAPHALRVVVLTDAQTDRVAALDAATGAVAGRFVWLDAARIDVAAGRRAVLDALLDAPTPTATTAR